MYFTTFFVSKLRTAFSISRLSASITFINVLRSAANVPASLIIHITAIDFNTRTSNELSTVLPNLLSAT